MPPSQKEALQKQIAAHTRRLQLLKERQAKEGIKTDPAVITEIEDIEAKLVELQAELEALPQIIRQNPYRGLSAFREEDAGVFFGRETFTAQLVGRVQQTPLVAVLGSSGSGKSSIVFAGLIPHLRREGNWLIASLRPDRGPFHAMAAALLPLLESDLTERQRLKEIKGLAADLEQGDLSLGEVASRILEKSSDAGRLLLVVDQFEELYTLCPEPKIRRKFLDVLLAMDEQVPLHLVLTLRADFMGQAIDYRPFADALDNEAMVVLGPMETEELRQAIEKPATKQGVSFKSGLVERILDDVSNEPGHLPLLEFALTALWEKQTQGELTHEAYETIGRVEGALSRYADQVFAGLSEAEQEQSHRVLVQLVRPGEGTEDTRRLARRDELSEADWPLVQQLADKRLVVTDLNPDGQETAEVVHEALIQNWAQLRGWMNEDRHFRTWQERLRAALTQWQASQQDEGALLRGAPLAEAEGWLGEREDYLSEAEQQFIQASVALRNREAAAREAQRQRELKEARRFRWLAIALGTALLLVVLLLGRLMWSSQCVYIGQTTGFGVHCQEVSLLGIELFKADLRGVDLSEADLRDADLSGANLIGAYLRGVDLSEADLRGGDLRDADLIGANLRGTNLSRAYLYETSLHGADLSWANLSGTYLSRASLRGANLSDADLSGAYLSWADLNRASLRGADLSWANLREADLRGANLRGAKLLGASLYETTIDDATQIDEKWRLVWEIVNQGAESRDLSGADLSGANLGGRDLSKVNLSEIRGYAISEIMPPPPDRDLREADLTGADLSGANLSGANLSEADLSGANLRGAKMDGTTQIKDKWRLVWEIVNQGVKGRDLSEADLRGANLSGANLRGAYLRRAGLYVADLRGANLSGADLSWADLNYAKLNFANLRGADLREANLRGADLRETRIDDETQFDDKWRLVWEIVNQGVKGRDLSEADLRGADLRGADLIGADLRGADLNGVDLREADLRGADLNGVDLREASLIGADLREANLSGVNLSGANLSGANLSGADLREADLSLAYLWDADLRGARYTEATKWPEGFTPPPEAILVD